MRRAISWDGRATGVGSLPHADPPSAVAFVLRHFPDAPFWPQLPRRAQRETMLEQWDDLGDPDAPADDRRHRAGLARFVRVVARRPASTRASIVKGQVTGPVTLAGATPSASAVRRARRTAIRGVIHQARLLRGLARRVLIVVDEPALGRATARATRAALRPVLDAIRESGAFAGVHDCGEPRPERLAGLGPLVVSFDAASHLALVLRRPAAREALAARLAGVEGAGDGVAWGIVPTSPAGDAATGKSVTPDALAERIRAAWRELGVSSAVGRRRSLVTPACGLALHSCAAAARLARLTVGVSAALR